GSGVSALKPNRGNGQRGRDLSDRRVHVQSGGHGPRGEIQSFRVFPSANQSVIRLSKWDLLSALDPQPVTRRPPLGTPRPEFGPLQEETGPWEPFITRPERVLLHFSA
ncbi:hypothetical protein JOQ06_014171, partial [Pogonophryne albipinna]